ncbi:hypothetical protein N2W54_005242 [Lotmaria passim]
MDMYMQALWLRIRDGAHASWAAAFPSDRPSGVFAVYTSVLNGGLLVWSFGEVLGHSCSRDATIWISFGMAHCYVNMAFGVASMVYMRRQIACGIPEDIPQWRVFCHSPLMVIYAFYIVCEVAWAIAAAKFNARTTRDQCARHITVQILFFVLYWVVGLLLLFQVTFVTERWRRPRWRTFAAMRWNYLHNTRRHRSVRWHDERDSDDGEEPANADRVELRHREDTERTSIRDYASMPDDMTADNDDLRGNVVVQRTRPAK